MTEEIKEDAPAVITDSPAHIVNQPGHQVGDKVLAVCGKKWKVSILWADVPDDHPICHECVARVLTALDEASDQYGNILRAMSRLRRAYDDMLNVAVQETELLAIVEETQAYADEKTEKETRKQALKDARALVAEADGKKKAKKAAKKEAEQPPIAPEENATTDSEEPPL